MMKEIIDFLLASHPAGGWFKSKAVKRKRRTSRSGHFAITPDSFHSRGIVKKQDVQRFNPAP